MTTLPSTEPTTFERDEIERSIPDRFARQVARHRDRVAITCGGRALTYDALDRAANRLARAILAQRGAGEEPVALLFEQGPPAVTAILAALKAGKIYVPLDPAYHPRERLAAMLEDSGAEVVVSDARGGALAGELAGGRRRLVNVDELDPALGDDDPGLPLTGDTLAYILYTSGSTGRPKGVVHNHRNVLHFVRTYTHDLGVRAADRQSLLFSCGVAAAVKNIFGALLNGATLAPFDLKAEGLGRLASWLAGEGVTLCQMVPTVLRHFVGTLIGTERFPSLRVLYVTGEPFYTRDLERVRAHLPATCTVVNALASTELNTLRQYVIAPDTEIAGPVVPVGYPVEDTEIVVLDEAGAEVAGGGIGEIAVKSRYLALGYWRRPDLTRQAFVADPTGGGRRLYRTGDLGCLRADGCLEYLGRKDLQVKIRGHRIDVGEVEAALLSLGAVRQAVVLARSDAGGDPRLVAYVVPAGAAPPDASALRRALAARLPEVMVPAAFAFLDALPVSAIGKVDLQALPSAGGAPAAPGTAFVGPRTATEAALAGIWAEALEVERVGVHDNFFDLGGHSLTAMQILARVRDRLDVDVPVRALFDQPTIAELAEYLDAARAGGAADPAP